MMHHITNLKALHKLSVSAFYYILMLYFSAAYSAGYYSEVICENDCMALPCCLTEIEMTLAFEMFIACICESLQNPSDASKPLLITLKR